MSGLFSRVKVEEKILDEIESYKEHIINDLNKMILESNYYSIFYTQNESIYFKKIVKASPTKFNSIPKNQINLFRLFDYLCLTKFMDSNDRDSYLKKEKNRTRVFIIK
jgi:hypothetical protein